MTAILKNSPWLRFLSQHIYCQSLWVFDHESRAWIKMPKLWSRKLLWPELQMCTEGHTSLLWAAPFSRQSIQPNLLAPRLFFVQKYCYRKTRTKTNEIKKNGINRLCYQISYKNFTGYLRLTCLLGWQQKKETARPSKLMKHSHSQMKIQRKMIWIT